MIESEKVNFLEIIRFFSHSQKQKITIIIRYICLTLSFFFFSIISFAEHVKHGKRVFDATTPLDGAKALPKAKQTTVPYKHKSNTGETFSMQFWRYFLFISSQECRHIIENYIKRQARQEFSTR
jgi:hypothetical protein